MKPAGLLLFIPAGLVAVLSAEEAPGLASRETKSHISEGLPTFQPPPPKPEGTPGIDSTAAPAADVLVLPKMTVKELRLPSDAADHLMSKRDFNRKMENLYLDTIAEDGPLNVLLNSITIPFLSPSKAQRGRAIYRAKEIQRLEHVIDVSKDLDHATAAKYKQEMDNSWTTRLPGRK